MSNPNITQKFSISNSISTSITSEQRPTWNLTWEEDNHSSLEGVHLPQYSWRKNPAAINCIEVAAESAQSPNLGKKNLNLKDFLRKKHDILQQIALEHSRLAGFLRDELDLTGIEPEGYAESMKAYDKAVDDFECFQIFMDSTVITEVNSEIEKRISHRETSYALSPRMLRRITYGSLQNIVQTQERESNSSVESNQIHPRNRASSTPREVFPPAISRSATISADSTAINFRPRELAPSETSEKTPHQAPVTSRHALQRFFSLKSLSESLPMINFRPPSGATQRSVDADDCLGSEAMSSHPPMQTRRAISRTNPTKLDELINWKSMEIATVQNILRANLKKAKDSVICKKSRKAYRSCAQENQKTLLRLYRENEELKEARQSALPSRSQSVGRFETSHSHLPPTVCGLVPPPLPEPESYQQTLQSHQNYSLSIGGDAVSETTSFHADEQSSGSSHSSAKQTHHSELTVSCQSSGSSRTDNSVSSIRQDHPSPALSHNSTFNHIQEISSDNQRLNPLDNSHSPRSTIDCVKYLFPDLTNQQVMRSYGRPNYSRYGSVTFGRINRPEELSQLPRFCPIQDSNFKSIYGHSDYHTNPFLQSNSQHRLVQYTSFATNYLSTPLVRPSPTHFRTNINNFPRDMRLVSELDQLTSPPKQQLTSSEVTPAPTSRPRFTLADKLNLCTTASTTSTSFH